MKVPAPRRETTTPIDSRASSPERTLGRLTPSSWARSRSPGRRSPGVRPPLSIRRRTCSTTRSRVLGTSTAGVVRCVLTRPPLRPRPRGRVDGLDHGEAAQALAPVAGRGAAGRDRAREVLDHAAVGRGVGHDGRAGARGALVPGGDEPGHGRAQVGGDEMVALDDERPLGPRDLDPPRVAGEGDGRGLERRHRARGEAQQGEGHVLALDRVQLRGGQGVHAGDRARAATAAGRPCGSPG